MSNASKVLALLYEIENLLPVPSELKKAQDILRAAESELPLVAGHVGNCDRWCRVWMLLFGAWQSLRYVSLYSDSQPLIQRLGPAHTRSRALLDSNILDDDDPTGWYAGYYLISAEYRIAGGFDRATKLFCRDSAEEDLRIYDRCHWLLTRCPKCRTEDYLSDAKSVLENFRERKGNISSVWKHVNVLKHGGKKPASQKTSMNRFQSAADAVGDAALVMKCLVQHEKACSL